MLQTEKIDALIELAISLFFDESIVKSKLPSSTININPMVPMSGNNPDKSGISILKLLTNDLIIIPVIINRITPGILVCLADNSKI